MHKNKVSAIPFYSDAVMEKWYKESLRTAEIIISLEEEYLNNHQYKHLESLPEPYPVMVSPIDENKGTL